ncbi:HNH endonuclease [Sphingobium aquiterrae]|uniref:HNH endonuclease n=1 Tax=Sphingobium aquiterrae TaxID=2038656 RepID=UPI00301ABE19
MTLFAIDPDPVPSEEDLSPYLARKFTVRPDKWRALAEMHWKLDFRERNPDAFVIPFAEDAFPAIGFLSYKSYQASALWKSIRREELLKAGGRCAACSERPDTIHHRDYRPRVLRGEDRNALIALCKSCHTKVHRDGERRERSWDESEQVLREIVIRTAIAR